MSSRCRSREKRPRRHVQSLQRAFHQQNDFACQPVLAAGQIEKSSIDGEDRLRIAFGLENDGADLRLVEPQSQQRIIELAKRTQRPELIAGLQDFL